MIIFPCCRRMRVLQLLLIVPILEEITVDELSTTEIKRLRSYLEAVLHNGDKGEGTTPTNTKPVDPKEGATTTPVAAIEELASGESGVADSTDEDEAIEEILRRFSAESMTYSYSTNCTVYHLYCCCASQN